MKLSRLFRAYRESDLNGHHTGKQTPYNAEITRFVQLTQSEKTTLADLKVPSSLKSISKVYMARPIRFGLINKYVKDVLVGVKGSVSVPNLAMISSWEGCSVFSHSRTESDI